MSSQDTGIESEVNQLSIQESQTSNWGDEATSSWADESATPVEQQQQKSWGDEETSSSAWGNESSSANPSTQHIVIETQTLEEQQLDPNNPLYSEVQSFEEIGLRNELLQGVYAMKYNKPSRIQARCLPILINEDVNLIAQSQSGTGKTATFGLGMLQRIDENLQATQALCICPTLELAQQIYEVITKLAQFTNIQTQVIVKGGFHRNRLTEHVLIGTPGKVRDLIRIRVIDTSKISMYVIDEADQMLEERDNQTMMEQVKVIRKTLPESCRVMLFSATYAEDELLSGDEVEKNRLKEEKVLAIAREVVPEPLKLILVPKEELSLKNMKQFFVDCGDDQGKINVLKDIYEELSVGQSIIFMNRKDQASFLCAQMRQDGFQVSMLHGSMEPDERRQTINEFKKANTKVLISTNLLSRGLDIATVTHVINFDLPIEFLTRPAKADFATYLHRIGRTARFGRSGYAINLISYRDRSLIQQLEQYFKITITEADKDDIADQIK